MSNSMKRFVINLGLLVSGLTTAFSGLLIQIKYHMGNHGEIAQNATAFGFDYPTWSAIHKISIVLILLFMIYHVVQHWNWYFYVISKKHISKNQQVLVLSLLFSLVAITGLTPWFIDLFNGNEMSRKIFIEVHDKLSIFLTVYLILHLVKRFKWFFITFEKIKKK